MIKLLENNNNDENLAEDLIYNISNKLYNVINDLKSIERLFNNLGLHSADIRPYFINYLEEFADLHDDRFNKMNCAQLLTRLHEEVEEVEED